MKIVMSLPKCLQIYYPVALSPAPSWPRKLPALKGGYTAPALP